MKSLARSLSPSPRPTPHDAPIAPGCDRRLESDAREERHALTTRFVFAHADCEPLKTHELVDRWEKIREVAELKELRWHDLRHASASFLIQNGASLAEVAHQLGHESVLTTKRYAHLVPGVKPTGADALNRKLRRTWGRCRAGRLRLRKHPPDNRGAQSQRRTRKERASACTQEGNERSCGDCEWSQAHDGAYPGGHGIGLLVRHRITPSSLRKGAEVRSQTGPFCREDRPSPEGPPSAI
jgi:hypothetical protein